MSFEEGLIHDFTGVLAVPIIVYALLPLDENHASRGNSRLICR